MGNLLLGKESPQPESKPHISTQLTLSSSSAPHTRVGTPLKSSIPLHSTSCTPASKGSKHNILAGFHAAMEHEQNTEAEELKWNHLENMAQI